MSTMMMSTIAATTDIARIFGVLSTGCCCE